MKDRHKGILIALFGTLVVSPDATLVRFLSDGGVDPWTIIFWKLLFSCVISATYGVWDAGGTRKLWNSMVEGKWYYAAAIPVQSAVDICFTLSFVYNSAANALLLINLNPLWCAMLGRLFLGDTLPMYTIVAMVLAFGCMLIIFVPEIIANQNDDGEEDNDSEEDGSSFRGNLISFFTGLFLATYISIVRKCSQSAHNVNLIGAAFLGALLSCFIAIIVRSGDVLPNDYWRGNGGELWQFWFAMVAEGLMIGTIFVALTIAPKLAKGAEVALVLLIEVLLGPLWVWVAYGDIPPNWTLVGGSCLLLVLGLHESRPLFKKALQRMSSQYSSRNKSKLQPGRDGSEEGEAVASYEKEEKEEIKEEDGACDIDYDGDPA